MDVELLYNSVKTKSQTVGVTVGVIETRSGRESHARPKGPLEPLMSCGPEKLLIRCTRESQKRPGPLGFRLSSPGER